MRETIATDVFSIFNTPVVATQSVQGLGRKVGQDARHLSVSLIPSTEQILRDIQSWGRGGPMMFIVVLPASHLRYVRAVQPSY